MGGIGSGEWARRRKATVEEMPCLPVACLKPGFFLKEDGFAIFQKRTSSKEGYASLWWKAGGFHATIFLEYTQQPFGRYRVWFKCASCGRRCTKIYIHRDIFDCRLCLNLTYRSCQLSDLKRHDQQALKIELKLGKNTDLMLRHIFDPLPPRPKHMHTSTYARLAHEWTHHKAEAFKPLLNTPLKV